MTRFSAFSTRILAGAQILAVCSGIVMLLGNAAHAQPAVLPEPGSPLRAELLNIARPSFVAEIGGPIEFKVRRLAVLGNWAFGDVGLQRPGGKPIDWSKTKFAEDLRHDMFSPGYAFFLLRRNGRSWSVAEISIGPTDVVWDGWRQDHGIPGALFGQ